MRISDWSSDVCSSDLSVLSIVAASSERPDHPSHSLPAGHTLICFSHLRWNFDSHRLQQLMSRFARGGRVFYWEEPEEATRSEEHTSELQSLMRISYAVFCLKNKNT